MNVSYRWLQAVGPDIVRTPEELADHLAARGAPVERLTHLGDGIAEVVIARVLEAGRHPNADRLSLCRVDAGGEELQVVCGAPNVEAGTFYPFAPVGSSLPGGIQLKRAKIRGEYSEGMLCSAKELGLGIDHAGILALSGTYEPGSSFVDSLSLHDTRMDVEITANRGDMLSHRGVARECMERGEAGLVFSEIPGGSLPGFELLSSATQGEAAGVGIGISDADLCPRYLGAVIRGVRVGPSPDWLALRLRAAGARPINNVVDATNYVLLETGQPLHAFDLQRLGGARIDVRRARAGESVVTLDGESRDLAPGMLAICDGEGPVAIAGVMGGRDTEVTSETVDVLLECALFEPASIRATRRALGMSTDASYRYERGVDPEGLERALRRAVEIVLATAGGVADAVALDVVPRPWTAPSCSLRLPRIERVLGLAFDEAQVRGILEPLGFGVTASGLESDALDVRIPGFRTYDVGREIDLIEEVARVHGYDAFPSVLAPQRPNRVPDHPLSQLEDQLRTALVTSGLIEVQCVPFAETGLVEVPVPVSANDAFLRAELTEGILGRLTFNLARGARDLRLFELGTVFGWHEGEPRPCEESRLAIVMTGGRAPAHWSGPVPDIDFWDARALFERVVARTWPEAVIYPAKYVAALANGVTWRGAGRVPRSLEQAPLVAVHEDTIVGSVGPLPSEGLDVPAWAGALFGLEILLPDHPAPAATPLFVAPSPFPAIERDLALLVPEGVGSDEIVAQIESEGGTLLRSVGVFDVYSGEGVPEGVRSIGFRLRFGSHERTLTDGDVDPLVRALVSSLEEEFDVQHRG